jgi:DNA primase large subunit
MAEDNYLAEALLSDFPFLKEIRDYVVSTGLRLEDFEAAEDVVKEAVKRVENALKPWRGFHEDVQKPYHVKVFAHPLAMALVAMLDSSFSRRRFAAYEAERYAAMLKAMREGQRQALYYIAVNVLSLRIREGSPPHDFWIRFDDYLKLSAELNEPRFKLVNRILDRGFVGVKRPEMITLVKNGLERLILERLERMGRLEPPDFLRPYVEGLRKLLEAQRQAAGISLTPLNPESWPPCMQALRNRLLAGEPVSHFGNFTLAAFMLRIGVGVDDVISMYSQRGDFDPRIARYQVEHIAGLKGSRTKYSVPRCATIQSHGLCVEEGRLCGGVKSPMQFYRRRARVLGRNGERGEADKPVQDDKT